MDPDNLTKSARRDFVKFVKQHGLEISALCGDLGHGFTDPNKNDALIAKTKKMVELAVDLKTSIITTHVGVIPDDEKAKEWKAIAEALKDIATFAANHGVCLATETGPEDAKVMKRFLDQLRNDGAKVNYDPANLVMMGFDQIQGVHDLRDYIVHTHAKDGVRIDNKPKEVPLGEGQVNFPRYLQAMEEIGFHGHYAIEREVGADPVADIAKAVKFLRQF
jgi:sugar phosphate isomerase/epimerase